MVRQRIDGRVQVAQEQFFVALVGIAHQHPARAVAARRFEQAALVLVLAPHMRAVVARRVRQQLQQHRFAPQDLGGAVGRTVVERDDAVHVAAQVVEATRQTARLVAQLQHADDAQARRETRCDRRARAPRAMKGAGLVVQQSCANFALETRAHRHHGCGDQPGRCFGGPCAGAVVTRDAVEIAAPSSIARVRLVRRAFDPVDVAVELLAARARFVRQVQQVRIRAGQQLPARHFQAHAQVVVVATPCFKRFVVAMHRIEGLARAAQRAVEGLQQQLGRHLAREGGGECVREFIEAREADAAHRHTARAPHRRLQQYGRRIARIGRLGRMDQHEAPRAAAHAGVDGLAGRAPCMCDVVDEHLPADLRKARDQRQHARLLAGLVERDHHLDAGPRPIPRIHRQHTLELGKLAVERQHDAEPRTVRVSLSTVRRHDVHCIAPSAMTHRRCPCKAATSTSSEAPSAAPRWTRSCSGSG
ncbi:hypothetical protein D9M69_437880 [compost metagenome]